MRSRGGVGKSGLAKQAAKNSEEAASTSKSRSTRCSSSDDDDAAVTTRPAGDDDGDGLADVALTDDESADLIADVDEEERIVIELPRQALRDRRRTGGRGDKGGVAAAEPAAEAVEAPEKEKSGKAKSDKGKAEEAPMGDGGVKCALSRLEALDAAAASGAPTVLRASKKRIGEILVEMGL